MTTFPFLQTSSAWPGNSNCCCCPAGTRTRTRATLKLVKPATWISSRPQSANLGAKIGSQKRVCPPWQQEKFNFEWNRRKGGHRWWLLKSYISDKFFLSSAFFSFLSNCTANMQLPPEARAMSKAEAGWLAKKTKSAKRRERLVEGGGGERVLEWFKPTG